MTVKEAKREFTRATREAERAALAGWHELADAYETVTHRGSGLASTARDRAGDARDRASDARDRLLDLQREAWRRGEAARDALAGRKTQRRRTLFLVAAAGVGAGAALVIATRRMAAARERARLAETFREADAVEDFPAND